jgi:hypothetical protein
MAIDIQNALACSELLLKLAGIEVSEDILLPSDQHIDASLKALNKAYGVKLKKTLKYANLLAHIPHLQNLNK